MSHVPPYPARRPVPVFLPCSSPPAATARRRQPRRVRRSRPAPAGGGGEPGLSRRDPRRHEPELAFRIGGEVIRRLVEVGERVKKDQPLAELDPQDVRPATGGGAGPGPVPPRPTCRPCAPSTGATAPPRPQLPPAIPSSRTSRTATAPARPAGRSAPNSTCRRQARPATPCCARPRMAWIASRRVEWARWWRPDRRSSAWPPTANARC
ncbi:hypothetical protein ACPA9J_16120 [Pseudomonas aeruginosa]